MKDSDYKVLLDISKAMAVVRDAEALLRIVMERIRPLFGFYDAGIFVLGKNALHHRDLTVHYKSVASSEGNERLRDAGLGWLPHPGSPIENQMRRCEQARSPLLVRFDRVFAEFPDYAMTAIAKSGGYKEALATLLRARGEMIGIIYLNSLEADFFRPSQFALFQQLADLIAAAVANILANEEILEREREKAALLAISEDVATIRSRDELLTVIYRRVRAVLPFFDSGLFVINKQENYHQCLTTAEMVERPPKSEAGLEKIVYKDSGVEYAAQNLGITSYDELKSRFPGHPHYDSIDGWGVAELIHGPLTSGGEIIGMLCFWAERKGFYTPSHLRVFKAVCDQIAVALANILANEEILEREREKALLLSLSEDMATIRNREDLWRVMMEKIRPLFGFDAAAVVISDDDFVTYRHLFTSTDDNIKQGEHFQRFVGQPSPVKGSPYQEFLWEKEPKPRLWDLAEAYRQYSDHWGLRLCWEAGLQQNLWLPLRQGGKLLGILEFMSYKENFFDESHFVLAQSVADQVAVAVANVLANEEIVEREREKSQLLDISKAIVHVQDVQSLYRAIYGQLQPLFAFDAAILKVLLPDGISFRHLDTTLSEVLTTQEQVAAYLSRTPIADSPNELTLGAVSPRTMILDVEKLAAQYESSTLR